MHLVTACPGCGSTSIRSFSYTIESERQPRDMHFAQARCRTCDLVFSNPVAGSDELSAFYDSRYYEEHEPDYQPRPNLEAVVRQRAREEAEGLRTSVLPYVDGGMFFEIGPGFGGLLAGARQLGFEVAGIEPSARAARFAREVMGLCHVRHGTFDGSEWPAQFCDVVYSFHVIEHVSDLRAFVSGLFRVLKPGGLAVVGTESHRNAWVAVRRVRSWLKGRRLPEFQTANHHTFYFSERSLRALLERHGFETVRCLVYTPSLEEKLPQYRFRSWRGMAAFYALHYADVWAGRGARLLVWARKPR